MRILTAKRVLLALLLLLCAPLAHTAPAARASAIGSLAVTVGNVALAAPATTDAQQQQAEKLALVREAFDLLYGGFIFPLPSNVLLNDAWDGINKTLTDAGATSLTPPRLTGVVESDWPAFAAAYRQVSLAGVVPATDLAYGAIGQMAAARNSCHTAFLTPDRVSAINGALSHQPTVDAGFVAGRENLLVYRIYPGSSAERAGLRPGDTLLTSDGKGPPGVVRRILTAKPGAPITVTVQRPGVPETVTLKIAPEVITLPFIRTQVLPGGIGVIQWDDFTEGAGQVEAIKQAIADFQAQGVVGWVLDLRTSPGGESRTEAAIGSLFITQGRLSTNIDRSGAREIAEADGSAALSIQLPMVVLVEHFSASAADILPGALQNNHRAYLIGEHTDGCISSSRFRMLADGSALQVEVRRVLIGPDDLNLDGIGITPDEVIVRDPETLAAGRDPQMDRAVEYLLSQAGQ